MKIFFLFWLILLVLLIVMEVKLFCASYEPKIEEFDSDFRDDLWKYNFKYIIITIIINCFSSEVTLETYVFYAMLFYLTMAEFKPENDNTTEETRHPIKALFKDILYIAIIVLICVGLSKLLGLGTSFLPKPSSLGEYKFSTFLVLMCFTYSAIIVVVLVLDVIMSSYSLLTKKEKETKSFSVVVTNVMIMLLLLIPTCFSNLSVWNLTVDKLMQEPVTVLEYCKSVVPDLETLKGWFKKSENTTTSTFVTSDTETNKTTTNSEKDNYLETLRGYYDDIRTYGTSLVSDRFKSYIIETDSSDESCLKDLVTVLKCDEDDSYNPILMIGKEMGATESYSDTYTNYKDSKGLITREFLKSTVMQGKDRESYYKAHFALLTSILLESVTENGEVTFCPDPESEDESGSVKVTGEGYPIYYSSSEDLYYAYVVLHQKDFLQILCMYQEKYYAGNIKIDYYAVFKSEDDKELINFYDVFEFDNENRIIYLKAHKQTHESLLNTEQSLEIIHDYWEFSPDYLKD